jgi:hypothetical protein
VFRRGSVLWSWRNTRRAGCVGRLLGGLLAPVLLDNVFSYFVVELGAGEEGLTEAAAVVEEDLGALGRGCWDRDRVAVAAAAAGSVEGAVSTHASPGGWETTKRAATGQRSCVRDNSMPPF